MCEQVQLRRFSALRSSLIRLSALQRTPMRMAVYFRHSADSIV